MGLLVSDLWVSGRVSIATVFSTPPAIALFQTNDRIASTFRKVMTISTVNLYQKFKSHLQKMN